MITIRTARPDDLPVVSGLLQRSYPSLLASDYDAALLKMAVREMAKGDPTLADDGTYFVAQIAGQIVGAAGWTARIPGTQRLEPQRANVRRLVVDVQRARQGIARQLMHHTVEHARVAGMTWMYCLSTRSAVPFYESIGFKCLGLVDVQMGAKVVFPSVAMQRQL